MYSTVGLIKLNRTGEMLPKYAPRHWSPAKYRWFLSVWAYRLLRSWYDTPRSYRCHVSVVASLSVRFPVPFRVNICPSSRPVGGSFSGLSFVLCSALCPGDWPLSSACFYLPSGRFLFRPVFRVLLCPLLRGLAAVLGLFLFALFSALCLFPSQGNAFSILLSAAMRFYALFPAIGRFHSSQISCLSSTSVCCRFVP